MKTINNRGCYALVQMELFDSYRCLIVDSNGYEIGKRCENTESNLTLGEGYHYKSNGKKPWKDTGNYFEHIFKLSKQCKVRGWKEYDNISI